MYTIGQLSKKTGVTVRTLDYYNEIDLLHPSSATDGGHRLYDEDGVMRLEQILALKYMGFSLQKIKKILNESEVTWQTAIEKQLEMVRQEKRRLEALEQSLYGVSASIQVEDEINWPIIFDIIQLFQKDPEARVHPYKKYFDGKEFNTIMQLNEQMAEKDSQEWLAIIQDIRANLNADPASETAQHLADRWLKHVKKMFGTDEARLEKMWEAITDYKDDIVFYPMDREVVDFIELVQKSRPDTEEKL